MFNALFNNSIAPAFQSQLKAQQEFYADLSRKMFQAAQQVSQLNLQLAQDLAEDMSNTGHQIMQAQGAAEVASAAAAQAYPITEKLRNYRQNLTSVVAGTSAELTKTAESHLPEISSKAAEVANEVTKRASDEIDKASQRSRETVEKMEESARRTADAMTDSRKQAKTPPPPPRPASANPAQGQPQRP